MSEMVERVAKAILVAKFGPDAVLLFEAVPDGFPQSAEATAHFQRRTDEARHEARAAIEAMREPTDEMMESVDCGGKKKEWISGRMHARSWCTMIDAALKE